MKALFLASSLVFVGQTSAYDILYTVQVDCHAGPGRSYELVKTYLLGEDVELKCQVHGETIYENDVWGFTPDNCYVPDYYIRTGYSGMLKDKCGSDDTGGIAGAVTSKPASAKGSPISAPTTELGSADKGASESGSFAPKMTKVVDFSSGESLSIPKSAAASTKPNDAGSLAAPFGNMFAVSVSVVYMLNLI